MTLNIHVASRVDIEGLAKLQYLSHTTAFAAFASPEWVKSRSLDAYKKQWTEFFDSTQLPGNVSRAWKAEEDGEVIGMVKISPANKTEAHLASMHVHPAHHRRGIGSRLMDEAVRYMKDAGFEIASLGVIQANEAARAMYERRGWTVHELHPTGIEGVPIAVYRLSLK
jgi:ribosomal protein S18 acetylase RimI-like enzyme